MLTQKGPMRWEVRKMLMWRLTPKDSKRNEAGVRCSVDEYRRSDHSTAVQETVCLWLFTFWFIVSWGWRADLSLHHFCLILQTVNTCLCSLHGQDTPLLWSHVGWLYIDFLASCFLKLICSLLQYFAISERVFFFLHFFHPDLLWSAWLKVQ